MMLPAAGSASSALLLRAGPPSELSSWSRAELEAEVHRTNRLYGVFRVLVVSDQVANRELLHQAANSTTRTVRLRWAHDSLDTLLGKIVTAAGASAGRLTSVGFLDHGRASQFELLRGVSVNLPTLEQSEPLREFFRGVAALLLPAPASAGLGRQPSALSADGLMGRIDLLACKLASDRGKHNPLIEELEAITGFNCCASTDVTGDEASGGNWVLETDGVNVAPEYFVAARLAHWRGSLISGACEELCAAIFCMPCYCVLECLLKDGCSCLCSCLGWCCVFCERSVASGGCLEGCFNSCTECSAGCVSGCAGWLAACSRGTCACCTGLLACSCCRPAEKPAHQGYHAPSEQQRMQPPGSRGAGHHAMGDVVGQDGRKAELDKLVAASRGRECDTHWLVPAGNYTWDTMAEYAIECGGRLPTWPEVICLLDGQKTGQDTWVAAFKEEDCTGRDWVQIGSAGRYGFSHVRDIGGYPAWGDTSAAHPWRGWLLIVKNPNATAPDNRPPNLRRLASATNGDVARPPPKLGKRASRVIEVGPLWSDEHAASMGERYVQANPGHTYISWWDVVPGAISALQVEMPEGEEPNLDFLPPYWNPESHHIE